MEIKVGDKFILHSTNGIDYEIEIVNINNCRPSEMKYAFDVTVDGENIYSDVVFQGDDWFNHVKTRLEKVEG